MADTTHASKLQFFFVPVPFFQRKLVKSRWFFCALCAMPLRACLHRLQWKACAPVLASWYAVESVWRNPNFEMQTDGLAGTVQVGVECLEHTFFKVL